MSLSDADIVFVRDLFAELPDLSTRKMFGGLGIYSAGTIFALMRSDGELLIKAQPGPFADQLAVQGCEIWSYTRKNGASSAMPYWTFPPDTLDDPSSASDLARAALSHLET